VITLAIRPVVSQPKAEGIRRASGAEPLGCCVRHRRPFPRDRVLPLFVSDTADLAGVPWVATGQTDPLSPFHKTCGSTVRLPRVPCDRLARASPWRLGGAAAPGEKRLWARAFRLSGEAVSTKNRLGIGPNGWGFSGHSASRAWTRNGSHLLLYTIRGRRYDADGPPSPLENSQAVHFPRACR